VSILFRLLLFFVSISALLFVLKKIRKSQAQIDNAIFWILFMLALVVISVFPSVIIYISNLIGIESPANFVFLCIIFILLLKVFHLSLYISKQQYQIQQLAQIIALEKLQKNPDRMMQNEDIRDEQR